MVGLGLCLRKGHCRQSLVLEAQLIMSHVHAAPEWLVLIRY